MKYFSTNRTAPPVDAKSAILAGLAEDGGLYMPEAIPSLPPGALLTMPSRELGDIATEILEPFFEPVISGRELEEIAHDTFSFPVPLRTLTEQISLLELFHGPTLAFKDFGARFLARAMSKLRSGSTRELTVLVATSGDTGSAVAHGFLRVPGIRVVILYPSGKVSRLQEQQLTTLGHNITALEVQGTFDDCQKLVKEAFLDPDLRKALDLTSANSINIGRLLPQSVYYFSAYAQLSEPRAALYSVPSGNLGNLVAGMIAKRRGLPVAHFVAATNINGTLAEYLHDGVFRPRPSVLTLSNAMDVGNPSNMARVLELANGSVETLRKELYAVTVSDEASLRAMREVRKATGEMLDPHAAVGFVALNEYRRRHPRLHGVVLGTAHPAKFVETVEAACGEKISLPPQLKQALAARKRSTLMPASFAALKEVLLSRP